MTIRKTTSQTETGQINQLMLLVKMAGMTGSVKTLH